MYTANYERRVQNRDTDQKKEIDAVNKTDALFNKTFRINGMMNSSNSND